MENASALRAFWSAQAALVSQEATYLYCRARTGFLAPKLFSEDAFLTAFEIARWETYLAVTESVGILAAQPLYALCSHEARTSLEAQLHRLYVSVLREHPAPLHRSEGWEGAIEVFRWELPRALQAQRSLKQIAEKAAATLYHHLPLHEDLVRPDRQMISASMRFRLVRFCEILDGVLKPQPLLTDIQRAARPPAC